MKSNSNERPAVIENLGNGAFYYNYNIVQKEEPATVDSENEQPRTCYDFQQAKIWGSPTRATIVKAVIREEIDETAEFNLINSYNAAVNGLLDEAETDEAKERYFTHLRRVQEIKRQVKADLAAAGYNVD